MWKRWGRKGGKEKVEKKRWKRKGGKEKVEKKRWKRKGGENKGGARGYVGGGRGRKKMGELRTASG